MHSHIIGKGVLDIIPNSKVLTQLVKSSLYNNTWKKEEGEEENSRLMANKTWLEKRTHLNMNEKNFKMNVQNLSEHL